MDNACYQEIVIRTLKNALLCFGFRYNVFTFLMLILFHFSFKFPLTIKNKQMRITIVQLMKPIAEWLFTVKNSP